MAINNPYIPGDPYSYDLKWLVAKVKEILQQLGTLDEAIEKKIFEGFLEHSIVQFHNVADMLAADMKDGSIVLTLGYYEAGDLGAMFYLIKDFNPGQCALDYFLTMDNNAQIAIPIVVTPYVTPEMFGAYGDGVANDTKALQIAASYPHVVMTKTYMMDEPVTMLDGQTIEGEGLILDRVPESTTPFEYPACFDMTSVSGCTISGLSFEGQGSVDGQIVNHAVIKVDASSDILIENISMKDINAGMCIRIINGSDGVTIRNCSVKHYSFTGITLHGATNCVIENNRLEELENYTLANTYPIGLSGTETSANPPISKHILCKGNYIKNSRAWWEGIDAHGGEDIKIIDNTIIGCMSSIMATPLTNPVMPMKGLIISGNICENSNNPAHQRTPAVQNTCISAGGEDVLITNNILKNGGCVNASVGTQSAIYFIESKNAVISGNVFENTNVALMDIRVAENVEICNNVSHGLHFSPTSGDPYMKPRGFYMGFAAALFKNVYIHDNLFDDTDLGSATDMLLAICHGNTNTGSYIKVENNVVDVTWIWYYGNKMVASPCIATDIATRVFGHVGDVCWNHAPAAGQPKGWICTATYVNGAGGSWTSLGNL